jgi:MFS family permease
MDFAQYAAIWRVPAIRQAVLFGALGKAPWFATTMILTLHVVGRLGQNYSAAGLLSAVFTVAVGLASPWRGRLLDRVGLRRTLLPSLLILPPAFIAAPFLPFWALLGLIGVVGLFAVPWFVLTRQLVIAAVPVEQRRTALALDSVVTELAFMVGPTFGILASVYGDTRWAVPLFASLSVAAGVGLWRANPPLASEDAPERTRASGRWLTVEVAGLFLTTAAITFILGGQDLSIIAAVRGMKADALLAVAMAAWAGGSLVGGLVYGGTGNHRVPVVWLALGLAVTTFPAVLARDPWVLSGFLALMGLCCAPALSATSEALSHAVPESRRGEAMGWQSTFSTVGNSVAPPAIGFVLDGAGWQAGFTWTGAVGVLAALAAAALLSTGRRRVTQAS